MPDILDARRRGAFISIDAGNRLTGGPDTCATMRCLGRQERRALMLRSGDFACRPARIGRARIAL